MKEKNAPLPLLAALDVQRHDRLKDEPKERHGEVPVLGLPSHRVEPPDGEDAV